MSWHFGFISSPNQNVLFIFLVFLLTLRSPSASLAVVSLKSSSNFLLFLPQVLCNFHLISYLVFSAINLLLMNLVLVLPWLYFQSVQAFFLFFLVAFSSFHMLSCDHLLCELRLYPVFTNDVYFCLFMWSQWLICSLLYYKTYIYVDFCPQRNCYLLGIRSVSKSYTVVLHFHFQYRHWNVALFLVWCCCRLSSSHLDDLKFSGPSTPIRFKFFIPNLMIGATILFFYINV